MKYKARKILIVFSLCWFSFFSSNGLQVLHLHFCHESASKRNSDNEHSNSSQHDSDSCPICITLALAKNISCDLPTPELGQLKPAFSRFLAAAEIVHTCFVPLNISPRAPPEIV